MQFPTKALHTRLPSLNTDSEVITRRKQFYELGEEDITRLTRLNALIEMTNQEEFFVDSFYDHLLRFHETRSLIKDGQSLERLKHSQHGYFQSLFCGTYDEDYFHRRLRIGAVHEALGLSQSWYLGAYRKYLDLLISKAVDLYEGNSDETCQTLRSVLKIVFLDISLAVDTYIELREERIRESSKKFSTLRNMSLAVRSKKTLFEVVEKIMHHGKSLVGADGACAAIYNSSEDSFTNVTQVDMANAAATLFLNARSGAAWEAIRTGRIMRASVDDDRTGTDPRLYKTTGFRDLICLPFTNPDNPEVVVCVLFFRQDRITKQSLDLLQTFSALSQQSINNAIRFREASSEAYTDPLTGIANRRALKHHLKTEWEHHLKQNADLSAIMIDIDCFKSINDTYGHGIGDQILLDIARRLRDECRNSDFIARYGGEEFVLLLPDTDVATACNIADRLRLAIASVPFPAEAGTVIDVTASLGVSFSSQCKADMDELLTNADRALYAAKRQGRNQVVIYE